MQIFERKSMQYVRIMTHCKKVVISFTIVSDRVVNIDVVLHL